MLVTLGWVGGLSDQTDGTLSQQPLSIIPGQPPPKHSVTFSRHQSLVIYPSPTPLKFNGWTLKNFFWLRATDPNYTLKVSVKMGLKFLTQRICRDESQNGILWEPCERVIPLSLAFWSFFISQFSLSWDWTQKTHLYPYGGILELLLTQWAGFSQDC